MRDVPGHTLESVTMFKEEKGKHRVFQFFNFGGIKMFYTRSGHQLTPWLSSQVPTSDKHFPNPHSPQYEACWLEDPYLLVRLLTIVSNLPHLQSMLAWWLCLTEWLVIQQLEVCFRQRCNSFCTFLFVTLQQPAHQRYKLLWTKEGE